MVGLRGVAQGEMSICLPTFVGYKFGFNWETGSFGREADAFGQETVVFGTDTPFWT